MASLAPASLWEGPCCLLRDYHIYTTNMHYTSVFLLKLVTLEHDQEGPAQWAAYRGKLMLAQRVGSLTARSIWSGVLVIAQGQAASTDSMLAAR